MADEAARADEVFLIVRAIVDAIATGGSLALPIPVNKIPGVTSVLSVVEQQSDVKSVKLFCHDLKLHHLHSLVFRYGSWAAIHYSAQSNVCWRRFAICKEAIHLLIDNQSCHFTTDVVSLIDQLVVGGVLQPDTPLDSERMAEVAAIELLLPWRLRPDIEAMSKAGATDYQIAFKCRVPQNIGTVADAL